MMITLNRVLVRKGNPVHERRKVQDLVKMIKPKRVRVKEVDPVHERRKVQKTKGGR